MVPRSYLRKRSAATAAAARDRTTHGALRTRVHELERLYRNAYAGDLVLTTIAVNVLKDSLRYLL